MPTGVLGLEAVDDVEEDYENVIVPAVNAAIAEHGKIRLVYMLGPEFDDYYEGGRLGGSEARRARQPASFERMAIVTDARWTAPALEIFSVLWPGQARAFPLSELEAAKRWAAADSS